MDTINTNKRIAKGTHQTTWKQQRQIQVTLDTYMTTWIQCRQIQGLQQTDIRQQEYSIDRYKQELQQTYRQINRFEADNLLIA